MTTEQQQAFEAWAIRSDVGYDINLVGYERHCCAADGFNAGWQAAIAWHKQHMQSPEMVERIARKIYTNRTRDALNRPIVGIDKKAKQDAKAAIAAIVDEQQPQPQVGQ